MTDLRNPVPVAAYGRLGDGTPCYAPLGVMVDDGDRLCCHLCGRWFRSVASHLRVHGWSKADYITAFGLELGNSLAGEETRKKRSAAMTARHATEPAIQQATILARQRARTGVLTAAAAAANRGRVHPPQRRPKTLATLAGINADTRDAGTRRRAHRHLVEIATDIASRSGYADLTAYLRDRLTAGDSMAAISRQAGLHKDWISRHLATVAPDVATARPARPHASDLRLGPVAARYEFTDIGAYLATRHLLQHRTVAAIAAEAGVSRSTILTTLAHHDIPVTAHMAKRHQAADRDRNVARALGFPSLVAYVTARRAGGATWKALVHESGLPETTLRRHVTSATGVSRT